MIIAPAASGKTAYVLDVARKSAQDLNQTPRVILPTRLQAGSWKRRLASEGGAIGVQTGTFDDLYNDILNQAGIVVTHLSEPIQKRLLKSVIMNMNLDYYQNIQGLPGFVEVVLGVIRELKAGGISPHKFLVAADDMGGEQRLTELGAIYRVYQERLQREDWADYIGAGWLSLEALQGGMSLPRRWSPVIIDGFDDFTPVQIGILTELAERFSDLLITLTGEDADSPRPTVHRRFSRTRGELVNAMDIEVIHLAENQQVHQADPAIRHLERSLFKGKNGICKDADAISMLAAPDRAGEVRNALRWLKKTMNQHGWKPNQVGMLFRNFEPYQPHLFPIAEEFGLPIYVEEGQPLRENPAIAALLNLFQIADVDGDHLAWRETLEAWRSPYFNWSDALPAAGAENPIGIEKEDVEILSWVARRGSVIQGLDQWQEAFEILSSFSLEDEMRGDEFPSPPGKLPRGPEVKDLRDKFDRFEKRIQPPKGERPYREFIAWIEGLIGDEKVNENESDIDLKVIERIQEGPRALRERDLEALKQFKDVLRGLLWAEKTVGNPPVTYHAFLEELLLSVDGMMYQPSSWENEEEILAADVVDARGIPFKAVAILGLGEGEFPQTQREDPFLRDDDRKKLSDQVGLPLSLSTLSWEGEYFYEAITRASRSILLTRARIADNGAPWQPSPYWEEVVRRIDKSPRYLTSQSKPDLNEASSWNEFLDSLCASSGADQKWDELRGLKPAIADAVQLAYEILLERGRDDPHSAGRYDGQLEEWKDIFSYRFNREHLWSASRLESYKTCPYMFFTTHVLGLEPREPPREGLDARQLGNIYHHIFENLYQEVGEDPSLERLREELPSITEQVLDQAPRKEGFRETEWWRQTRKEIESNVARSLEVLERLNPEFSFYRAEKTFGIQEREGPALVVEGEGRDTLKLRGYIDRVDRDHEGGLRIIDYKTSSPYGFNNQAIREGKKLQLPLYALAAERALKLGLVKDGFYFHVRHAEPSRFQMNSFFQDGERGPKAAMARSVEEAWKAVRRARDGMFVPQPPENNCPDYCPAMRFCWQYKPRSW